MIYILFFLLLCHENVLEITDVQRSAGDSKYLLVICNKEGFSSVEILGKQWKWVMWFRLFTRVMTSALSVNESYRALLPAKHLGMIGKLASLLGKQTVYYYYYYCVRICHLVICSLPPQLKIFSPHYKHSAASESKAAIITHVKMKRAVFEHCKHMVKISEENGE